MNRSHDFTGELPDDSIDAQAAAWFARNRQDQDLLMRQAFEQWLREPAHASAYRSFEVLWADLGELQQLNRPTPLPVRRYRSRWRPALAAAAALFVTIMATHLGTAHEVYQQQIAAQAKGQRTFELPDGSTLSVNANTQLRVDFDSHQRRLTLDRGQFYIDVAPDKERPLWVQTGNATIRVVGTGFDVRRSDRQLVVSVAHGQVAFTPDSRPPQLLGAQQQVALDLASGTLQQNSLASSQVADWRTGHLSFRNRELASLVDELNLYRPRPVVLANAKLGQIKVSGNLDVDDPDALINALPALVPVKTVALADGGIRIENR
ncbi:iron dicitrate transport regulator FecR [Pseudomonas kribbensis]|uniref:Iron dicitrate transport regulator FecR n=1 Tax=Pseudomonas kribbensis TaxID=1628086 RepID=A0A345RLV8_9PSED|nr:FecR domain-containing protein [Pseudomonas kribbensis]AXI60274.1 iron dicitrate transport regulator FecR [Pseudomonas kribbensis]